VLIPSPASTSVVGSVDQNSLTNDQIVAADLPTAYDLVERLRRKWLIRDTVTGGDVAVYMDERNIGGAEALRNISSTELAGVQYLSYDKAVQRWGSGVNGGVIVLTRRN